MKITSISLDEESAEIAEHIPNLSAFVRSCLLRWANQNRVMAENQHLHWRENYQVCWPFSSRGLCHTCWPDGPPPHEVWIKFCDNSRDHLDPNPRFKDLDWLKKKAREHSESTGFNLRNVHFERYRKNDQDRKARAGIFARLRAILAR